MPDATTETFIPMVAAPQLPLKRVGQLLGAMSEGRRLVLMPTEQEFTAVEAANFLNVSRPSLPCLRGEGVDKNHGACVRRRPNRSRYNGAPWI